MSRFVEHDRQIFFKLDGDPTNPQQTTPVACLGDLVQIYNGSRLVNPRLVIKTFRLKKDVIVKLEFCDYSGWPIKILSQTIFTIQSSDVERIFHVFIPSGQHRICLTTSPTGSGKAIGVTWIVVQ